jgi:hypothetical protein
MSSEGLSLFLDAIRSKERTAGPDMLLLLEYVQLTAIPNRNDAQNQRFAELTAELTPAEQKLPDAPPDFIIPEHSLDDWIRVLTEGNFRAIRGIHFKENNGCVYKNTAADSYEVNVEEAGYAARDTAVQAAQVVPTEAAQQTIINDAMRAARTANRLAQTRVKNWVLLKRELPNDTRVEDSLLRYVDEHRKKPEWGIVITNLKNHGEKSGYDSVHYKQALDRWISFFLPSLQKITENMTPNEVVTLLISMHKPKSQFDILQKEMMDLVRFPGEDLESKIALLRSLATSMYKDFAEHERLSNVERILLNGILQFTHGVTRKNAELTIEFEKRQGKHVSLDCILKGAINSERVYGAPTMPLPYNKPLNPATMVYNVQTEIHPGILGLRPLVDNGFYRSSVNVPANPLQIEDLSHRYAAQNMQNLPLPPPPANNGAIPRNNPVVVLPRLNLGPNPPVEPAEQDDSLDEEAFLDAQGVMHQNAPLTEHPARQHIRQSGRETREPTRYGSSAQNISLENLEPFINDLVTYYVASAKKADIQNPDRNPQRSRSKDYKRTENSRSESSDKNRKVFNKRYPSKSPPRRNSSYRDKNASQNTSRSNSRNRSSSRDGRNYNRRDNSRKTSDRKWSESEIEKGVNCSIDYKPKYEFRCLKCMTENSHHEFQCKKFHRRAKYACTTCGKGFHFRDECGQERSLSRDRDKSRKN